MTKLNVGTLYSFTISPSDTYQYFKAPERSVQEVGREKKFDRFWRNLLNSITENNIDIYLQTELSEPVKDNTLQSSRLHFHGYIRFPTADTLKWFLLYGTILLDRVCSYYIDTISDYGYWNEYVHKQKFLLLPRIATVAMEIDISELSTTHPFIPKDIEKETGRLGDPVINIQTNVDPQPSLGDRREDDCDDMISRAASKRKTNSPKIITTKFKKNHKK